MSPRLVWPAPPRVGAYQATEALWDPTSRAMLRSLGVGRGWRCLEIGAGGGTMSAWLGQVVGASGRVLATDLHPELVATAPNVEVRYLDASSDTLEGEFDLIYARLVIEYVGAGAIPRLAARLVPGATLLLEDYDWSTFASSPTAPAAERAMTCVQTLMRSVGLDPWFGQRLPALLSAAGVRPVKSARRTRPIRGGSVESGMLRRALEAPASTLIAAGCLDDADVDAARAELADPKRRFTSPTLVAAWGTRPTSR